MKRKVVVTGIGAISPLGNTVKETWNHLLEGKSGIGLISLFNTENSPVKIAGEVKNFDPASVFPQKDIKKVGRFIQLAMAASLEAYSDSGLEANRSQIPPERFGINIGVGMGGLPEIEDTFEEFLEKGYRRVSPFFIPQVISNLATGQVAIALNLQGPSFCAVSACASSGNSIGESARTIERGEADLMLAGGAEAVICRLGIAGFAAMRALSTRNAEPDKASRPFDVNRDGFVMSEGAAVLILEEKEHAQKRGAKIYAELAGYGSSTDAYHITTPSPDGTGAKLAMRLALKDSGLTPADIDYVNAHATSTPTGDYEEAKSIAEVFSGHHSHLHISSTKSSTGHLLGAAGAIEAIFSILAIQNGVVPATQNLEEVDPKCAELGLNFTPHTPVEKSIRAALSNSFGFGGANACLIFKKV
jgi:3-oxoacyl-[acyl-carrier-protein] synthase II